MNISKYLASAAAILLACSAVSCKDDNGADEPATKTHIYLGTTDGSTSMAEDSDQPITVEVALSAAAKEALTLEFELIGDAAAALELEGNPLTIGKGETTGTFSVKSRQTGMLTEAATATFAINGLDASKYDLLENLTITVLPGAAAATLTPEQKALLDGYKETLGIDLYPWMGNVALTGSIEFPGSGTRDPFVAPATITLNGQTLFTLGADATEDTPALDMAANPMGMTEYLHKSFRQLTVEDKEYFDNADADYSVRLMRLLNWSDASAETFAVTLPGLKITSIDTGAKKAAVEFVTEGDNLVLDSNGNPVHDDINDFDLTYDFSSDRVPFKYSYSAWDRMLALIEGRNPDALELMSSMLSHPAQYLGISSVLTDDWEIDEDEDGVRNLYTEPKGEIDFANGTMTFEFPFDHADQYGYSRVKVVYSLAK